jgi:hypothetical protein
MMRSSWRTICGFRERTWWKGVSSAVRDVKGKVCVTCCSGFTRNNVHLDTWEHIGGGVQVSSTVHLRGSWGHLSGYWTRLSDGRERRILICVCLGNMAEQLTTGKA